MNLQPTLHSPLIKLEPLKASDLDDLYFVGRDPFIWEQHPNSDRYKREVFQKYFDGAIQSNGAFKVVDGEKQKIIGCTRYYDFDEANKSVKIGYTFLAKDYWGGLFNHEMKKLLIDYAFEHVDTIIFEVGSTNLRSIKALRKIGASYTSDIEMDGIPHQTYKIKKEDWLKS
jgi:RimJ/RimL family protein N-acetyltransferase